MVSSTTLLDSWGTLEVTQWLTSTLEMPSAVAEVFRSNAVGGRELAGLSDDDLTRDLGLTGLQARKVRRALTELGVAAPGELHAPATPPAAAPAVPPAVAAPEAPAPPQPEVPPSFAPDDLRCYSALKAQVAELQELEIAPNVDVARKNVGAAQARLSAAQEAQQKAQAAAAAAQRRTDALDEGQGCLGKLCRGRSHHAKQEASRAELAAAQKALVAAQVSVIQAQEQVGAAQQQLAAWQGKSAELDTAQRSLDQLVGRMFAAPDWQASPRVSEIGDELRVLEAQAAEASHGAATYNCGMKLLTDAATKLEGALQSLHALNFADKAQGSAQGTLVIAQNKGMPNGQQGSRVEVDAVQMSTLRSANDAASEAAQEAEEARALLGPEMPQVDEGVLAAARTGLFQDVIAGGIGMDDVMQAASVRSSTGKIETLLSQVGPAAQWAQSGMSTCQASQASLHGQADVKRGELDAYRAQQLAAALA